jgi:ABC-type phosphate transport system substrate-binding protein
MYSRQDSSQAVLDFLDWILSVEAQQIVADLGFVPVQTAQ